MQAGAASLAVVFLILCYLVYVMFTFAIAAMAASEVSMPADHKHPGENNQPHETLPDDQPPHDHWEGLVEGEELNELDYDKLSHINDEED